jgi:hypothetical protein
MTTKDTDRGALARARRFIGQVTGLDRVAKVVRGAIDPMRPEPPTLVTEPLRPRATPAVEIAPVEIAPVALAPVEIETIASVTVEVEAPAPTPIELLDGEGMCVVHRGGRAWLVWRAPSSRLTAIGKGDEMTLRAVSIGCAIGELDAEVRVETADGLGLAREGARALSDVPRPCIAAIGVGRGSEFVAVAHARVA